MSIGSYANHELNSKVRKSMKRQFLIMLLIPIFGAIFVRHQRALQEILTFVAKLLEEHHIQADLAFVRFRAEVSASTESSVHTSDAQVQEGVDEDAARAGLGAVYEVVEPPVHAAPRSSPDLDPVSETWICSLSLVQPPSPQSTILTIPVAHVSTMPDHQQVITVIPGSTPVPFSLPGPTSKMYPPLASVNSVGSVAPVPSYVVDVCGPLDDGKDSLAQTEAQVVRDRYLARDAHGEQFVATTLAIASTICNEESRSDGARLLPSADQNFDVSIHFPKKPLLRDVAGVGFSSHCQNGASMETRDRRVMIPSILNEGEEGDQSCLHRSFKGSPSFYVDFWQTFFYVMGLKKSEGLPRGDDAEEDEGGNSKTEVVTVLMMRLLGNRHGNDNGQRHYHHRHHRNNTNITNSALTDPLSRAFASYPTPMQAAILSELRDSQFNFLPPEPPAQLHLPDMSSQRGDLLLQQPWFPAEEDYDDIHLAQPQPLQQHQLQQHEQYSYYQPPPPQNMHHNLHSEQLPAVPPIRPPIQADSTGTPTIFPFPSVAPVPPSLKPRPAVTPAFNLTSLSEALPDAPADPLSASTGKESQQGALSALTAPTRPLPPIPLVQMQPTVTGSVSGPSYSSTATDTNAVTFCTSTVQGSSTAHPQPLIAINCIPELMHGEHPSTFAHLPRHEQEGQLEQHQHCMQQQLWDLQLQQQRIFQQQQCELQTTQQQVLQNQQSIQQQQQLELQRIQAQVLWQQQEIEKYEEFQRQQLERQQLQQHHHQHQIQNQQNQDQHQHQHRHQYQHQHQYHRHQQHQQGAPAPIHGRLSSIRDEELPSCESQFPSGHRPLASTSSSSYPCVARIVSVPTTTAQQLTRRLTVPTPMYQPQPQHQMQLSNAQRIQQLKTSIFSLPLPQALTHTAASSHPSPLPQDRPGRTAASELSFATAGRYEYSSSNVSDISNDQVVPDEDQDLQDDEQDNESIRSANGAADDEDEDSDDDEDTLYGTDPESELYTETDEDEGDDSEDSNNEDGDQGTSAYASSASNSGDNGHDDNNNHVDESDPEDMNCLNSNDQGLHINCDVAEGQENWDVSHVFDSPSSSSIYALGICHYRAEPPASPQHVLRVTNPDVRSSTSSSICDESEVPPLDLDHEDGRSNTSIVANIWQSGHTRQSNPTLLSMTSSSVPPFTEEMTTPVASPPVLTVSVTRFGPSDVTTTSNGTTVSESTTNVNHLQDDEVSSSDESTVMGEISRSEVTTLNGASDEDGDDGDDEDDDILSVPIAPSFRRMGQAQMIASTIRPTQEEVQCLISRSHLSQLLRSTSLGRLPTSRNRFRQVIVTDTSSSSCSSESREGSSGSASREQLKIKWEIAECEEVDEARFRTEMARWRADPDDRSSTVVMPALLRVHQRAENPLVLLDSDDESEEQQPDSAVVASTSGDFDHSGADDENVDDESDDEPSESTSGNDRDKRPKNEDNEDSQDASQSDGNDGTEGCQKQTLEQDSDETDAAAFEHETVYDSTSESNDGGDDNNDNDDDNDGDDSDDECGTSFRLLDLPSHQSPRMIPIHHWGGNHLANAFRDEAGFMTNCSDLDSLDEEDLYGSSGPSGTSSVCSDAYMVCHFPYEMRPSPIHDPRTHYSIGSPIGTIENATVSRRNVQISFEHQLLTIEHRLFKNQARRIERQKRQWEETHRQKWEEHGLQFLHQSDDDNAEVEKKQAAATRVARWNEKGEEILATEIFERLRQPQQWEGQKTAFALQQEFERTQQEMHLTSLEQYQPLVDASMSSETILPPVSAIETVNANIDNDCKSNLDEKGGVMDHYA
ncbi:hypothetical protein BGZ83_003038 [Gryganskiella cystojenkinii]|nr:hypothetical protein BGZ83_003038 [Gryganskiella cystojenkinii]